MLKDILEYRPRSTDIGIDEFKPLGLDKPLDLGLDKLTPDLAYPYPGMKFPQCETCFEPNDPTGKRRARYYGQDGAPLKVGPI